jgi:hypothetical protein
MGRDGYYYLHVNGDVIFKRDLGGTYEDLVDTDFAVHIWHPDKTDRADAWELVVEAMAFGANAGRLTQLEERWGLDEDDGLIYCERLRIQTHYGETENGPLWTARIDGNDGRVYEAASVRLLPALAELARQVGCCPNKGLESGFNHRVRRLTEGF